MEGKRIDTEILYTDLSNPNIPKTIINEKQSKSTNKTKVQLSYEKYYKRKGYNNIQPL